MPNQHTVEQICSGDRFGWLTVKGTKSNLAKGYPRRLVRCDCRRFKVVATTSLRRGKTKSCGCRRTELVRLALRTHGDSETRLYNQWTLMRQRCYNPNRDAYRYYGGEGKEVCAEWRHDYVAFKDWALTSGGYQEGLTIERLDNAKGYSPDNCTWIPRNRQPHNTRRTVWVTMDGETKRVVEWVEDPRCVVSYDVLKRRVKEGWSHERAITTPTRRRKTST